MATAALLWLSACEDEPPCKAPCHEESRTVCTCSPCFAVGMVCTGGIPAPVTRSECLCPEEREE